MQENKNIWDLETRFYEFYSIYIYTHHFLEPYHIKKLYYKLPDFVVHSRIIKIPVLFLVEIHWRIKKWMFLVLSFSFSGDLYLWVVPFSKEGAEH